jgi:hypothetical protein
MAKDELGYDRIVERQLRGVAREVLAQVGTKGLPGDHHFYITFRTDFPGVSIGPTLKAQFPKEITIVLQHQFWGLEVTDEAFAVTLSFNGKHERLHVPFGEVRTAIRIEEPEGRVTAQRQVGPCRGEGRSTDGAAEEN